MSSEKRGLGVTAEQVVKYREARATVREQLGETTTVGDSAAGGGESDHSSGAAATWPVATDPPYQGLPLCQVCGDRDAYMTSDCGPMCHRQACIDAVKSKRRTSEVQPTSQQSQKVMSEVNEEREHVLTHLRNAATVARNRAAEITLNGGDAKKYSGRAEHLGQLANEIEKGKHLPKGRQRHELRGRRTGEARPSPLDAASGPATEAEGYWYTRGVADGRFSERAVWQAVPRSEAAQPPLDIIRGRAIIEAALHWRERVRHRLDPRRALDALEDAVDATPKEPRTADARRDWVLCQNGNDHEAGTLALAGCVQCIQHREAAAAENRIRERAQPKEESCRTTRSQGPSSSSSSSGSSSPDASSPSVVAGPNASEAERRARAYRREMGINHDEDDAQPSATPTPSLDPAGLVRTFRLRRDGARVAAKNVDGHFAEHEARIANTWDIAADEVEAYLRAADSSRVALCYDDVPSTGLGSGVCQLASGHSGPHYDARTATSPARLDQACELLARCHAILENDPSLEKLPGQIAEFLWGSPFTRAADGNAPKETP